MKKILIIIGLFICLKTEAQNTQFQYLDATNYANLNHSAIFNVLDFGLKADGVTDNSPLLRTMISKIPNNATVYFPANDTSYLFTDSVSIYKSLKIIGDGKNSYDFFSISGGNKRNGTRLFFNSSSKNFLYITKHTIIDTFLVGIIKDITIQNTAALTPTAGAGIIFNNMSEHWLIDNITIYGFFTDIDLNSSMWITIQNSEIVSPVSAGLIMNAGNVDAGGHVIRGCNFISGYSSAFGGSYGIWIKGGGGDIIEGCFFNGGANEIQADQFKYCIYSDFSAGVTTDYHIINDFFENFQTTAIYLRSAGGQAGVGNIQILNCEIAPVNTNTSQTGPAIDISNFVHVHIDDIIARNYLSAVNHPVIKMDSCTSCYIGPNITFSEYTSQDSILHESTFTLLRGVNSKTTANNVTLNGYVVSGISPQKNFLKVLGTLDPTPAQLTPGVYFNITGSGSSGANAQIGTEADLQAGYTGVNLSETFNFENYSAGAGNTLSGGLGSVGNFGVSGGARGTATSSLNGGSYSFAFNGGTNVGGIFDATFNQYNNAAGKSLGVIGMALRANVSAIEVGGWFGLTNTTLPTLTSAALEADIGTESVPIFAGRINGSNAFVIGSAGLVTGYGSLNTAGYGLPAIQAQGDLTAQTGAAANVTTLSSAAAGDYEVQPYLTITAVATDVLNVQVTWTDETNTSRTQNFFPQGTTSANCGSVGIFTFPSILINVKASTNIVVATVLQTSGGSVTYDVGAAVKRVK